MGFVIPSINDMTYQHLVSTYYSAKLAVQIRSQGLNIPSGANLLTIINISNNSSGNQTEKGSYSPKPSRDVLLYPIREEDPEPTDPLDINLIELGARPLEDGSYTNIHQQALGALIETQMTYDFAWVNDTPQLYPSVFNDESPILVYGDIDSRTLVANGLAGAILDNRVDIGSVVSLIDNARYETESGWNYIPSGTALYAISYADAQTWAGDNTGWQRWEEETGAAYVGSTGEWAAMANQIDPNASPAGGNCSTFVSTAMVYGGGLPIRGQGGEAPPKRKTVNVGLMLNIF